MNKGKQMDITTLLYAVVEKNASDLHISAGMPIMIRLDGDILPFATTNHSVATSNGSSEQTAIQQASILKTPQQIAIDIDIDNVDTIDNEDAKKLIYQLMTAEQQAEFEQKLSLDFAYQVPNLARFRVNAFHHNRGISAVLRVIPNTLLSAEQIGLSQIMDKLTSYRQGLVLVTGATGCGKSTTLASIIDHINQTRQAHILTIEDPIEFIHHAKSCLVHQREVKRDTPNFHTALHSALREDPDVILIGELRDIETIRLALTAAETGHLVLATLHTNSATKTIDRLIDVFPAEEKEVVRAMLSESLQAIICQTLLKSNSSHNNQTATNAPIINTRGSNSRGSGSRGRVPAHEVMFATPAIRNLIRNNKVAQMYSAIQTGASDGMITMEKSIQNLVNKNLVSKN